MELIINQQEFLQWTFDAVEDRDDSVVVEFAVELEESLDHVSVVDQLAQFAALEVCFVVELNFKS